MTDNAQSDKQENSTVVETLAMRDLAELKQSILDMSHPNIKSVLRELAEAKRYDKRVCDALGMKTVDPEEALNVIDGLRERLRAAEQDAARYRWLREYPDNAPIYAPNLSGGLAHGKMLDAAIDAAHTERVPK